jgi:phosphatidylglycerol lysyltransferase
MGDPVGPPEKIAGAVRAFLERCEDFGATPAFYEVRKSYLHHYADFGLSLIKLGEEARVDLNALRLEGGGGSRLRQAIRRLEKAGATFRIVAAHEVSPLLAQLRRVSDQWLGHKPAEKGFSLGFFDDDYIRRFPVALVEIGGEVVAFANLWTTEDREEASIDLMRYDDRAPVGVMESLMVQLMLWAKREGYRWFSLGMAPLSGLEPSSAAPMWSRLGALAYEHGEAVYHFQGLRAFKEKFNPLWEPHYLAYRGTVGLPRTLADVTALIAGGYRRLLGGGRRH